MSFYEDIEVTLFYFGFRKCKKKKDLNFLKLNDNDYLLMRIFEKVETADLIHARFETEDNPCESEPYWENSLKLGFIPKYDNQVLRDFIKQYKKD